MKSSFLSLILVTLFLQNTTIGTDPYLNSIAVYTCERLANSEISIESLRQRDAIGFMNKRGLDEANKSLQHQRKMATKGIKGFDYDGYVNFYLLQSCPSFDRLFERIDIKHFDNKRKRAKYIELHRFARDFMQADTVHDLNDYFTIQNQVQIHKNLQSYFKKMQELRWDMSLQIFPPYRNSYSYEMIFKNVNDLQHIFEISVVFNKDGKIGGLISNEYTKDRPKPEEVIETIDVVPAGH